MSRKKASQYFVSFQIVDEYGEDKGRGYMIRTISSKHLMVGGILTNEARKIAMKESAYSEKDTFLITCMSKL